MQQNLETRARELGLYVLETGATVRAAAAQFGISKSTVHKDLTQRLREFDPPLCAAVRQVLDKNKQERHIRGGLATKEKYSRYKSSTSCTGFSSGTTGRPV